MLRLLQSSWFVSLAGCLTYLGTTAALINPAKFAGFHRPDTEERRSAADDPSWKFRNPEFDQWVGEIKHEKENLALREQQLQEMQTRLESEQQELNAVTQSVVQMQAEFDRNVIRYKAQEIDNLKRQIKVLNAMPPDSAAGMLGDMQNDDVVRILVMMKPDQASVMLDAMSKKGPDQASRAAAILERMRNVIPPGAAPAGSTPSQ